MNFRQYLALSRAPRYSVLFALPLLLVYELMAWGFSSSGGSGVRNGADVVMKWLFVSLGGRTGLLVFELLLVVLGAWLIGRDWKSSPGRLSPRVFLLMLAESAVLALLVGLVVGRLTQGILHPFSISQLGSFGIGEQIMLSIGAGIYEELLFRVILVGALAAIGVRAMGWSKRTSGVVACIVGALIFSGFHYIGSYGDSWQLASFTFRAIAGLVFSGLYLTRGFGVTAWTHALYDVFLIAV